MVGGGKQEFMMTETTATFKTTETESLGSLILQTTTEPDYISLFCFPKYLKKKIPDQYGTIA